MGDDLQVSYMGADRTMSGLPVEALVGFTRGRAGDKEQWVAGHEQ